MAQFSLKSCHFSLQCLFDCCTEIGAVNFVSFSLVITLRLFSFAKRWVASEVCFWERFYCWRMQLSLHA